MYELVDAIYTLFRPSSLSLATTVELSHSLVRSLRNRSRIPSKSALRAFTLYLAVDYLNENDYHHLIFFHSCFRYLHRFYPDRLLVDIAIFRSNLLPSALPRLQTLGQVLFALFALPLEKQDNKKYRVVFHMVLVSDYAVAPTDLTFTDELDLTYILNATVSPQLPPSLKDRLSGILGSDFPRHVRLIPLPYVGQVSDTVDAYLKLLRQSVEES